MTIGDDSNGSEKDERVQFELHDNAQRESSSKDVRRNDMCIRYAWRREKEGMCDSSFHPNASLDGLGLLRSSSIP